MTPSGSRLAASCSPASFMSWMSWWSSDQSSPTCRVIVPRFPPLRAACCDLPGWSCDGLMEQCSQARHPSNAADNPDVPAGARSLPGGPKASGQGSAHRPAGPEPVSQKHPSDRSNPIRAGVRGRRAAARPARAGDDRRNTMAGVAWLQGPEILERRCAAASDPRARGDRSGTPRVTSGIPLTLTLSRQGRGDRTALRCQESPSPPPFSLSQSSGRGDTIGLSSPHSPRDGAPATAPDPGGVDATRHRRPPLQAPEASPGDVGRHVPVRFGARFVAPTPELRSLGLRAAP